MSTRVLQFMTGNPLRKTNSGSIELFKECSLGVFDDHQLLDPARLSAEKTDLRFTDKCLVCIVTVPSFMIPHDILQFLTPVLPDVKRVSTLRYYATHDSYFVLLEMTSVETAKRFIQEYHGAPLCSLQPTTCLAYSVKDVVHSDAVDNVGSHEEKHDTLTENNTDSNNNSRSSCTRDETEEATEEELCVLCLAPLEALHPASFTTCCGHTFHVACTLRLENSQCPVCRTQLDDAAMDSQSRCAVCSWPHPQPAPGSSTSPQEQWLDGDQDLWVCLVCGFIGCGEAHSASGGQRGGHMREHYQQHLHAYAMNTETRRVWDFAGEGYVHRLILNQHEESTNSADLGVGRAVDGPSLKIVEVHRPGEQGRGPQGLERSQVPPLSQQQEDFVVTRKLETAAEHFSAVLAWKLEQQRQHFEGKLAHLRALNSSHSSAPSSDSGGEGSNTREDRTSRSKQIILSLRNEKLKLLRQTELAHERLRATLEDRNLLSTFTTNLQENQQEWEGRALAAKEELQAAEDSYRTNVPLLERRVRTLMKQLDSS